jgi:hypothetical protein
MCILKMKNIPYYKKQFSKLKRLRLDQTGELH